MTDASSAGSASRLFPPPPIATSKGMLQMLQLLQQPVFAQLSQVGNTPPPPPVSSDKEPMLLSSGKSELSLSTGEMGEMGSPPAGQLEVRIDRVTVHGSPKTVQKQYGDMKKRCASSLLVREQTFTTSIKSMNCLLLTAWWWICRIRICWATGSALCQCPMNCRSVSSGNASRFQIQVTWALCSCFAVCARAHDEKCSKFSKERSKFSLMALLIGRNIPKKERSKLRYAKQVSKQRTDTNGKPMWKRTGRNLNVFSPAPCLLKCLLY